MAHNGEGTGRFPGTRGRIVRLAQKILDRCIFVFFCEDMGRALGFPPQLLRDFLIHRSNDPYFDLNGFEIWETLLRLFRAMNEGTAFGGQRINQFNGGLFASDPVLERLLIPNSIFCEPGQGQNEAILARNPRTLLYLSAAYNYAAGWSEGLAPAGGEPGLEPRETKSLGLYTLGRIFEQSITELEILEADADDRPSLNRENKRKRDGVYYTPEWVVERIVAETVGGRLASMKTECGWPAAGSDRLPDDTALDNFDAALREFRIVDPACGSGAFLITALRYMLDEWTALRSLRRERAIKQAPPREGWRKALADEEDALIRDILRRNIYGVDINPASVEIAKLALWLHTARGDQPLSGLDDHIREGNSLIGPEFFEGNLAPYDAEERERINAFDWQSAFPEVFARDGFDAVVGNPPYVKLQNFRRVHGDMAAFLARSPTQGGRYASTQTGNFDLYLHREGRRAPQRERASRLHCAEPLARQRLWRRVAPEDRAGPQPIRLDRLRLLSGVRRGDHLHRAPVFLAPAERRRLRGEGSPRRHREGAVEHERLRPTLRAHRLWRPLAAGDRRRAHADRPAGCDLPAARQSAADARDLSGANHQCRSHLSPDPPRARPLSLLTQGARRAAALRGAP